MYIYIETERRKSKHEGNRRKRVRIKGEGACEIYGNHIVKPISFSVELCLYKEPNTIAVNLIVMMGGGCWWYR